MMQGVSTVRKTSYVILVAVAAAVVWLHLGPALLAGLLSYTVLDLTHRRVTRLFGVANLRWPAVLVFVALAVGAVWILVYFAKASLATLPKIVVEIMPQIIAFAEQYNFMLPFEDVTQLRVMAVQSLTENIEEVTKTGGVLTERVFHVVLGIFVAVIAFLAPYKAESGDTFYHQLYDELGDRLGLFMDSFGRVFGAQVVISAINTGLTSIFLLALGFPNAGFLVAATFLLGLLPIIGNVLSNTLIVGTALTLSFKLAVLALVFLVVIHKLEYFLNSRIVGASIRLPMWQTLLGILVGESILGLPGIVLAPAVLHYVREELLSVKALPAAAVKPAPAPTVSEPTSVPNPPPIPAPTVVV